MVSFTPESSLTPGNVSTWQQAHLEAVWQWATSTVWGCPMGSVKSDGWRQAIARPRGLMWGGVLRGLRPWVVNVPKDSPLRWGATDGHRLVLPVYLLMEYLADAEREKYHWSPQGRGVDGFLWACAHAGLMQHQAGHVLPLEYPAQRWTGTPVPVLSSVELDAQLLKASIVLPSVPSLTPRQIQLEWAARLAIEAPPVELGDEPADPLAQPVLSAWRKRVRDIDQALAPWTKSWSQPFQEEDVELSVVQVKESGLPSCLIPKEEEAAGTRFRCWNGIVDNPALSLSKHEWRTATKNWPPEALSFHLGQAVADNQVAFANQLLNMGASAQGHNQMLFDVKDASLIQPLLAAGADLHVDHHDAMGAMGVLEWACLSKPHLVPEFLKQGAQPTTRPDLMPLSFRVVEYLCTRDDPAQHVNESLQALEALQAHGHALAAFHETKVDRRLGGEDNKQSVDLLGWTLVQVAQWRYATGENLAWLDRWLEGLVALGVSATHVAPHLPALHVLASQGRPGMDFVGPLLQRHGASILDVDGSGNTALHALCQSVVVGTSSGQLDPARLEEQRLHCAQLLSFLRGLQGAQSAFDQCNAAHQTPDAIVRPHAHAWQVFEPVWSEWAAEVRQYRLDQAFPASITSPRLRM